MTVLRNCTPTVRVGRTQTQIALTAAFPECSAVLLSGVEDAVDHISSSTGCTESWDTSAEVRTIQERLLPWLVLGPDNAVRNDLVKFTLG